MNTRILEPNFHAGNRIRVAVVGVGDVGSSTAFALLKAGVPRELVLSDINLRRAEGQRMDLDHCVPFFDPCDLMVVPPEEVEDCDLVVVSAGASQEPGETRLDLLRRNEQIMASLIPGLARRNPRAILMIITNPADLMTHLALELSGFPPERVFSTGTVLDTARFRQMLSATLHIATSNIHAYVIGEHGDSEVLVWSRTLVGPFRLGDYAARSGIAFGDDVRARIDREVRRAAYEIIERKGSTHFAIAMSITRLATAIFGDEEHLFTISRRVDGLYGLDGVCLSLPVRLNRRGATLSVEMELSPGERAALMQSAETIQHEWRRMRGAGG